MEDVNLNYQREVQRENDDSNHSRIYQSDPDGDDDVDFNTLLHTPKRRKINSTSKYIHQALFEEGQGSDVTVVALGSEWHLHKVFLCQSPYFSSMFSGNWIETNKKRIEIEILDENITIDALRLALGQFYKDDIVVEAAGVRPLLAAATLLQMEPLIQQCAAIMLETINIQTVLSYHETAHNYGVMDVKKACRKWLLHNLLTQVTEHPATLRRISPELMHELVASPHLYVIQTEYSVYVMLKTWVFLCLHPCWKGGHEAASLEARNFFRNRSDPSCFLEQEGKDLTPGFSALRFVDLISNHIKVEELMADRILPVSWLTPAAMHQWYNMLRIDQGKDKGPVVMSEEEFDNSCTRCGLILENCMAQIWRWKGYNFGRFGSDLEMTFNGSSLRLKRDHPPGNCCHPHPAEHNILYRITIISLNDQKQVVYSKTSGIQAVALCKNEKIRVLSLDQKVSYPLLISANFLFATNNTLGYCNNTNIKSSGGSSSNSNNQSIGVGE